MGVWQRAEAWLRAGSSIRAEVRQLLLEFLQQAWLELLDVSWLRDDGSFCFS